MNKRIEELAVSSGIYDSLCDPYDALNNGDYYSSIKIDLEKFAQLIVRECCEVLEQTEDALDRQKWPTPRGCVEYIKDHFEVEQ
jgi:hypothetical protein